MLEKSKATGLPSVLVYQISLLAGPVWAHMLMQHMAARSERSNFFLIFVSEFSL